MSVRQYFYKCSGKSEMNKNFDLSQSEPLNNFDLSESKKYNDELKVPFIKKYFDVNNIDKDNRFWMTLSLNTHPEALKLLENNLHKVEWIHLSGNESAIHILEKNLNKVHWGALSKNKNAIHILEKNLDKVEWENLCLNPKAIRIIEQNLDKVNWSYLCQNENAIHLIEQNLDKVDWSGLSFNKNAIYLLEKNLDKVNWMGISCNPNAISIIENNLDKVDWSFLSYNPNPNIQHILENNLDKSKNLSTRQGQDFFSLLEKKLIDIDEVDLETLLISNHKIFDILFEKDLTKRCDLTDLKSLCSNPKIFELDDIALAKLETVLLMINLFRKQLIPKPTIWYNKN